MRPIGYVVHTTVIDEDQAFQIAEHLITRGLCACVQVISGVTSFYKWQGKLERTQEHLIFLKTTESQLDGLMDALKKIHPYEVPEIIATPITSADPEYLKWMLGSVKNRG